MSADAEFLALMGPQLELLLPTLDERGRRLVLGAVARAAGDGGIAAVARLTGTAWQTVADGASELGLSDPRPRARQGTSETPDTPQTHLILKPLPAVGN